MIAASDGYSYIYKIEEKKKGLKLQNFQLGIVSIILFTKIFSII